jgi:hypothetical protein
VKDGKFTEKSFIEYKYSAVALTEIPNPKNPPSLYIYSYEKTRL